jgi:hypothetical protein
LLLLSAVDGSLPAERRTAAYGGPLIPMAALSLPARRQAVATVAPSRLPEFFQEIQDAFTQAGDEDSVFPIRHFYQRWDAAIAIERRPSMVTPLASVCRIMVWASPWYRPKMVRLVPSSSGSPATGAAQLPGAGAWYDWRRW